ncbi:LPXTG cell wall anchor domain-containing protein [Alloscardovia omnicolens]|uniref:LPXTG cell wall anchor domain-containing protein n=1 Tax=Alloscardovia omnicolens TaxID=419015 RepID=UPI003A710742
MRKTTARSVFKRLFILIASFLACSLACVSIHSSTAYAMQAPRQWRVSSTYISLTKGKQLPQKLSETEFKDLVITEVLSQGEMISISPQYATVQDGDGFWRWKGWCWDGDMTHRHYSSLRLREERLVAISHIYSYWEFIHKDQAEAEHSETQVEQSEQDCECELECGRNPEVKPDDANDTTNKDSTNKNDENKATDDNSNKKEHVEESRQNTTPTAPAPEVSNNKNEQSAPDTSSQHDAPRAAVKAAADNHNNQEQLPQTGDIEYTPFVVVLAILGAVGVASGVALRRRKQ